MTGSLPLVALNCPSFGRSQINPRSRIGAGHSIVTVLADRVWHLSEMDFTDMWLLVSSSTFGKCHNIDSIRP
jgi:hypothetical protein